MTRDTGAPYTMRALQQMLGLSRGVIGRLIAGHVVTPARGARNEYRFSFQDVVLLRTAHALREARVPQRRLLQALRQLRADLPAAVPLSGLRIQAVGDRVAVLAGRGARDVQSGQLLLDFEIRAGPGPTAVMALRPRGPAARAVEPDDHATRGTAVNGGSGGDADADDADNADSCRADTGPAASGTAAHWHRRGQALESRDPPSAEAAYRRAVQADAAFAPAWVDLLALLCHVGRSAEALALAGEAARAVPQEPRIPFNAAIALEDLQRPDEALHHYELCLHLDPGMADAHFNAARLCERLGDARGALRHYSACRRLERQRPPPLTEDR